MKAEYQLPIRLLTHNIRYATNAPFQGEELWTTRAPRLISELRFNTIHYSEVFVCLQEVLHQQLIDILNGLNEQHGKEAKWDYTGVGRDDGKQAGEYSPILYQPAIWDLQVSKTIWLSETPEKPSKSWDAASIRILTIGVFQHRLCKRKIVAMNTHLDDQGGRSRLKAAKIILSQISEVSDDGRIPVFLAGDFNSQPNQEAYQTVTGNHSPMRDLCNLVPPEHKYGHHHTFSGFGCGGPAPTRIDFLFLNSIECTSPDLALRRGHWLAKSYAVLENRFDDGVFNSDHRAVIGDVVLQ
ncbi:MAG: hypothetical protein Q9214_003152 [Letrouitia sp. 1 TL-2023]